jgi:putative Mn2+ efflux pump MntP
MSYIELLLLGISLCFDTFAVSLTGGICMGIKLNVWQTLKIILTFALFQMGLTLVGWFLGTGFYVYIERIDHWIAFTLLIYIGGGMLLEGIRGKDKSECQECGKSKTNLLNPKTLCIMAVATSIDALAVGISLAMVSLSFLKLIIGMSSIFLFTALASYIGLNGGRAMGDKLGSKPEMVGGLILVGIGVKILLEHLVF